MAIWQLCSMHFQPVYHGNYAFLKRSEMYSKNSPAIKQCAAPKKAIVDQGGSQEMVEQRFG